jgi:hypothetical protein
MKGRGRTKKERKMKEEFWERESTNEDDKEKTNEVTKKRKKEQNESNKHRKNKIKNIVFPKNPAR